MSSKYPVLPPSEIIRTLQKFGFEKISQKGSHVKLKNYYSNRVCIVPMHDEVAKGTLKSILEQSNIKLEDFLRKL